MRRCTRILKILQRFPSATRAENDQQPARGDGRSGGIFEGGDNRLTQPARRVGAKQWLPDLVSGQHRKFAFARGNRIEQRVERMDNLTRVAAGCAKPVQLAEVVMINRDAVYIYYVVRPVCVIWPVPLVRPRA